MKEALTSLGTEPSEADRVFENVRRNAGLVKDACCVIEAPAETVLSAEAFDAFREMLDSPVPKKARDLLACGDGWA